MSLPPTVPMHPLDVVFGTTIPQIQAYGTVLPSIALDEPSLRSQIGALLQARFPRLCYDLPLRWGTIRTLRLAAEPAAPLRLLEPGALRQRTMAELEQDLGDRRWALLVEPCPEGVQLWFLMDHYLCHGYTGRAFLFAAADAVAGEGGTPPPLPDAAVRSFEETQHHLTDRFLEHEGGWAEHRQREVPAAGVRELARALGVPFTDATMLWIARTVHDVSPRSRPMEVLSFRMERDRREEEILDLEHGNKALAVELWEMLPDGFYTALDPSGGLGSQQLEQFVEFYRTFPFKGLLTLFLRSRVRRDQAAHKAEDREKLVINNLGSTDRPFYRVMFFDPFNDADRLGLVFADGRADRLTLQFSPPKRYLAWFPWDAFEQRLDENLVSMVQDPRLETQSGGSGS